MHPSPSLYSFFLSSLRPPPRSTLFPYTTLFRSLSTRRPEAHADLALHRQERARRGLGGRGQFHLGCERLRRDPDPIDRKSTRLNSSHTVISYAVFCLKKKKVHGRQQNLAIERIA